MKRVWLLVGFISIIFFLNPHKVDAGCAVTMGLDSCFGSSLGNGCVVSGNKVTVSDCGIDPDVCGPGDQWHCTQYTTQCDTGCEAKHECGQCCATDPPGTCVSTACGKGTCDSSSCSWNGNADCSLDFPWHNGCDQPGSAGLRAGCYWDSMGSTDWNYGVCRNKYCMVDTRPGWGCFSYANDRTLCQANGCNWGQLPDNSCADACSLNGASCGQMQCHDSCTGGLVNAVCPVIACTHSECVSGACAYGIAGASQAGDCTTNSQCIAKACSGAACQSTNWTGRGTATQTCQIPTDCAPTCTVSLSTPTPTISVGGIANISATVTTVPAGTTIGSINWTSSAPAVGTIPSPTVTGIVSNNVTGVSAGTTNISATVNLAPSGSCSTTTSLGITVLPKSWWQVSGGDVYANNINSQIPLSCTTGCYINLAN